MKLYPFISQHFYPLPRFSNFFIPLTPSFVIAFVCLFGVSDYSVRDQYFYANILCLSFTPPPPDCRVPCNDWRSCPCSYDGILDGPPKVGFGFVNCLLFFSILDAVLRKRLAWTLFCCYQPLCVVSQQNDLGFFVS